MEATKVLFGTVSITEVTIVETKQLLFQSFGYDNNEFAHQMLHGRKVTDEQHY